MIVGLRDLLRGAPCLVKVRCLFPYYFLRYFVWCFLIDYLYAFPLVNPVILYIADTQAHGARSFAQALRFLPSEPHSVPSRISPGQSAEPYSFPRAAASRAWIALPSPVFRPQILS